MDDIPLIYDVEKRPNLYVLTHKLYKKTRATKEAWNSIGAVMGKTGRLMYFFVKKIWFPKNVGAKSCENLVQG